MPGLASLRLTQLSDTNNVYIVVGLCELDHQNNIYNVQLVFDPEGQIVKYRKINLSDIDHTNAFTAGDETVFLTIDSVKTALCIGSDLYSEKVITQILDGKPDVVLYSTATTDDYNETVSVLGRQLNKWVVMGNHFGPEDVDFPGYTEIINPAGTRSLQSKGEEGYIFLPLAIE